MDWCKYNDCVIATGSVDRTIKVWDVRVPDREVSVLAGHAYAVRRCAQWRPLRQPRASQRVAHAAYVYRG